jgi:hypothetical protein
MAPLTSEELQADIRSSDLLAEYGQTVDRDSAREMLARRIEKAAEMPSTPAAPAAPEKPAKMSKTSKVLGGAVLGSLAATVGRTVGREMVRGLFGLLGAKPPRKRRRTTRW